MGLSTWKSSETKLGKDAKFVGKQIPRMAGYDIVTGQGKFTGDMKSEDMGICRVKRSPYPHAEIISIDTSKAEAADGVYCVVTYKDVPEDCYCTNGYSPAKHAKPLDKTVRYIGDAVALVVAKNALIADEAMDLIEIEYKQLPAVLTIQEALAPGAPQLYEALPGNIAKETPGLVDNLDWNTGGDMEKGFSEADIIIDMTSGISNGQNPNPAEPPTIICNWDNDGLLDVWGSVASISYCTFNLARSLNMYYEQIRMQAPLVGGSFGSKLFMGNVYPLLFSALAAKKARRPVMYEMSKDEHLTTFLTRMNMDMRVKLGMKKDGTVTALDVEQYTDAGVAATMQQNMMTVGCASMSMLTRTENMKYSGKVVMTNKIASGSFRGYGYMETTTLISRAIFRACREANLDPIEYFAKNLLHYGQRFYNALCIGREWITNQSPDWEPVLRRTADEFGWKDRFVGWGKPYKVEGTKRYGVGMGVSGHSSLGDTPSNTEVTIFADGGVQVKTVVTEHGTGVRDLYRKMVADELNLPLERVTITRASTQSGSGDQGGMGARSTYAGGLCTLWAARDVRQKFFESCHDYLGYEVEDMYLENGQIRLKSDPEKRINFTDFLFYSNSITGVGHWDGAEDATVLNFQFVEVEVDTETGVLKLIDHLEGAQCGTVVNPLEAKNQMDAWFPGSDIAVLEETVWDPNNNRVLSTNMVDYKCRTFNDAPPHKNIAFEDLKDKDSIFPFGAMGFAEPVLGPGAPAITMAIYNAIGIEMLDYPFTPDKILAKLKEREASK